MPRLCRRRLDLTCLMGATILGCVCSGLSFSAEPATVNEAAEEPVAVEEGGKGSAEAEGKEADGLSPLAPEIDQGIRRQMQDRDYDAALQAIHREMGKEGAPLDYLTYLQGRAFFLQEDYAKAVQVLRLLDSSFPESVWRRRARFDAAQAYARQGDFQAAEAIYRAEAEYLFGPERRQEIADIYLEFADEAFSPDDDREEPDYAKALKFYLAALDVGLKEEKQAGIEMRIAQCHQSLDEMGTAAEEYTEFIKKYPESELVIEARYRLGACQLEAGELVEARRSWRDLLEAHAESDSPRIAEASFRLAETWGIPDPANSVALDLGLGALRSFVERFPDHEDAGKAHMLMAESFINSERFDEAVDCLKTFLADPRFADSDGIPEARDLLGQSYQLQEKYDDAIRVWRTFLLEHTADERWNEVQREIINTEYLRAAEHYEREEYAKAREYFTKFLAQYPLDGRCSGILFLFGEMDYREKKWDDAIVTWRRVVSKYSGTRHAGDAQFRIAQTLEEELGKYEEALEAYGKVVYGPKTDDARQAVARLLEKRLGVATERVFRTDEPARIKLTTRNIESVTIRVYPIDMETYFRKMNRAPGVEQLDVALIDPDETIEFEVPDYEKYREISSTIELPFEGDTAGVMAVNVSSRRFEATTLVIRSDLDVIVKSSRDEVFVFAENMRTGKACPAAKVLVTDGRKLLAEGETGEDGVFRQGCGELANSSETCVLALLGDHVASNSLDLSELEIPRGLKDEGYLYTDRPAYRAGEEVHVRGWIRRVHGDKYVADAGRKCTLQVFDVRDRMLREKEVVLSEFGAFHDSFALPATSPQGEYRLLVRDEEERTYTGKLLVQEYEPEPIRLVVDSPRKVYYRGETIEGTIRAEHYYGAPVAGKELRFVLTGSETRTAVTDDNGVVQFSFPTREYHEEQLLELSASLPQYNVDAKESFLLATQGYTIGLSTVRRVFLAGESFEVTASTTTPDGKPAGHPLQLKVFQQTEVAGKVGERFVEAYELATDEADGTGRATVALKESGRYVLRAEGKDRFGNPVSGETRVTISGDEDEVRLRILADRHTYRAGDQSDIRVHWRGAPALAWVTFQGARVLDYRVVELKSGSNALPVTFGADLAPNFELSVAVMSDGDRKKVEAVPAKRFHEANSPFTVQRDLVVHLETKRAGGPDQPVRPGDEMEVTLTTSDSQGNSVAAEVSLAMVQQALLDRFKWSPGTDLLEAFQGSRREPQVRTESSICFEYRPETHDIDPFLLSEQERLEIAREEEESRKLGMGYGEPGLVGGLGAGVDAYDTMGGYAGGMMGGMGGMGGMVPEPAADDPFGRYSSQPADDPFGDAPTDRAKAIVKLRELSNKIDEVDPPGEATALPSDLVAKFQEALRTELEPSRESQAAGYWNPTIVTDKNGQATVTIPMPEDSTAWRLVVKGITVDTLVGEADRCLVVKKDLFGQMRLPLAFTDGDKVQVPVSIYHEAPDGNPIEVTLKTTIGGRSVEETQTIQVEKKGITEIAFQRDFRLPTAEEVEEEAAVAARSQVEFELTVKSGERQDRVRRVVPVLPYGAIVTVCRGGSATGDTTTWIEPVESMPLASASLQIVVGPTVERSLLDAVLGQSGAVPLDPFGCSSAADRAGSELMAALALQDLLAKAEGADRPEMLLLDQRIRAAIASLVASQKEGGGWSWAGAGNRADDQTSAYVLWALSLARKAGFTVPDKTFNQAVQQVREAITRTENTDYAGKAVLLHGLTVAGNADFNLANRLHRVRAELSTPALLYLVLTFAAMDRQETAAEVLKLVTDAKLKGSDEPSALLRALFALALQEVSSPAAKTKEAVDWLLENRRGDRWSPEKATGPAVAALCRWFGRNRFDTEHYKLDVFVNETKIRTLDVDSSSPTHVVDVPAGLVAKGKQQIRFQMTGHGRYTFQAVLRGFVPAEKLRTTTTSWLARRVYEPAYLEIAGRPVTRGFQIVQGSYKSFRNPVTQLPVGQRAIVLLGIQRKNRLETPAGSPEYLVVHETIPSGTEVVADSVTGPFEHYEIVPGGITFYLGDRVQLGTIRYELHGTMAGQYRAAPTIIRDAYRPDQMVVVNAKSLTVLPAGEKSSDAYRLTPMELFDLGQHEYGERRYEQAAKHLGELLSGWTLRQETYKNVVHMLLDIHLELGPPEEIVRYFEILIERWPEEEVSFEQVLKIGAAYEQMGEFERSFLAFRGTVEGRFMREMGVAGFLESQDEFLRSVAFMQRLLQEYPSEGYAATAMYALAQRVASQAPEAKDSTQLRSKKITRIDLTRHAARMLDDFLTIFPDDPSADQAAFARANALLEMEAYDLAIADCNRYASRYPKSELLDSFWYLIGYCQFAAGRDEEALEMCRKVSEAIRVDESTGRQVEARNKWLAIYILGQIYHSLDRPKEAIEEYRQVEDRFDDARASIEEFERKRIRLPELTTVVPGAAVELDLEFRNLATCDIKVYGIDLMKFGLLRRNLGGISQINLAGVHPRHDERISLGDGEDYSDRTHKLTLPLKEEGAYLVVCRGENLHTSGLVILSPLSLDVHQDRGSRQVRATVKNVVEDRCERDVHIKVIGSRNRDFVSGSTDLRGIFVADEIQGEATVIAFVEPSRYALHRGAPGAMPTDLGALPFLAGDLQAAGGVALNASEIEQRIKAVLKSPTSINVVDEPLEDVAEYLGRVHRINIQLDKRALEDVNMEPNTPVTVNVSGVSLRSALRLILGELDLTYVIRDEVLMITTPEEAELQLATKMYPVSDLVKFKDPSGETWVDYDTLIAVLTATVQPESWEDVGGPGTVAPISIQGTDVLTVRQTEDVHEEIAAVLSRMRSMVEPREGDDLPVRRRSEGPYGPLRGMGGMGSGGLGGMGGGFGAPSAEKTDLLQGLQETNRAIQGKQVEQFDKMIKQGGMGGGMGAGFF